jgi:hypothetical protein
LPHHPLLIVASRLADEYLWAEVLNLGGHDVLAKPFQGAEVQWVLESAWRIWTNRKKRASSFAVEYPSVSGLTFSHSIPGKVSVHQVMRRSPRIEFDGLYI